MTPSGKPLSWSINNAAEANDIIPVCELLVEFWAELGLKVDVKTLEYSILATMRDANELLMRVMWAHSTQLWHYLNWSLGDWGPLGISGGGLARATALSPRRRSRISA